MSTLGLAVAGSALSVATFGIAGAVGGGIVSVLGVSTGLTVAQVGAAVGGLVGSYIDQTYLIPAIFGEPDFRGPRLDDIRVQTSSEGTPIKRCWGPENRISGTVIQQSDFIKEWRENEGGGKGFGGGSSQGGGDFVYFMHFAIGLSEGPIIGVKKIWADKKVIFGTPDPISIVSSDLDRVNVYAPGTGIGRVMIIHSKTIDGGPDFTDSDTYAFQDGAAITISGFEDQTPGGDDWTVNNGTWTLKRVSALSRTNEVQTLTSTATGGNFRLQIDLGEGAAKSDVIQWDDDATAIFAALKGHPDIGGNGDVTVAGGPLNTDPVTVTFGNTYKGQDVDLLTITDDNLTGGTVTPTETTKGETTSRLHVQLDPGVIPQTGDIDAFDPQTITIEQTPDSSSEGKVDDIRIYLGDGSQAIDSTLEALEGEGNVPAYRHIAYVVIEKLKLTEFGNRPPQFEFLLESDTTITVPAVIGELVEETGRTAADYDTSGLTATNLLGYCVHGAQSTTKTLEPLMIAYDITAKDSGGKLVFLQRGNEDTLAIAQDVLAAHEPGNDAPPAIIVNDPPGVQLPSEVTVRHIDTTLEYQQGVQGEKRINPVTNETTEIDIPIVLTPSEARDIAARMLWEPWSSRQTYSFRLPPSYIDVEETDILTVTVDDEAYPVRLSDLERGVNHTLDASGLHEDRVLLPWNSVGEDGDDDDEGDLYTPPATELFILDIPVLRAADVRQVGYYAAIAANDRDASWQGASIYRSRSGTSNQFELVDDVPVEAIMGEATTVLGDGPVGYWDRENTVDVDFYHGTPSSASEIDTLNGANRMFVGDELIAFQDATLVSDNTYRLSKLIRGLNLTGDQTSSHVADEPCVQISDSAVRFIEGSLNDVDVTWNFRGVPNEGDVTTWPIGDSITFAANTLKCWAPINVLGYIDGGNNYQLGWVRRSRTVAGIFGPDAAPIIPTSERYEIDVLSGPGGTVVNTYGVEDATTFTYAEADQITDFGSAQSSITVVIYQIDEQIGRGYATAEISLPNSDEDWGEQGAGFDSPLTYASGGSASAAGTAVITVTSDYTIQDTDCLVLVNATSGDVTITVPAATGRSGSQFKIKKIDSSVNIVTIDPVGLFTIDDASSKVLSVQYDSITVMADSTEWYII